MQHMFNLQKAQTSRPGKEPPHECDVTSKKNIEQIKLGHYTIVPPYFSPYPKDLCKKPCIYICEFCLKYMISQADLERHLFKRHQDNRSPPGCEIYCNDGISVFEVDGGKSQRYALNLCLLAKLFLDAKNVYEHAAPFLFYVMTHNDDRGQHIMGYFCKVKKHPIYNLSCILVLPPYQLKGYGKFLIELSYELSKRENKTGTPERPFSDMGWLTYQSFWAEAVLEMLVQQEPAILGAVKMTLVKMISKKTAIAMIDVMNTLETLNFIHHINGERVIWIDPEVIKAHLSARRNRNFRFDSKCLKWQPTVN